MILRENLNHVFIENLTENILEIFFFGAIFYYLSGTNTNYRGESTVYFIMMYIPIATLILSIDIIQNIRKDYIKGKWEVIPLKNPKKRRNYLSRNLWLRMGPEALFLGLISASLCCYILLTSDHLAMSPFIVLAISATITLLLTTIIIRRHIFREIPDFAATLTDLPPFPNFKHPPFFCRFFLLRYAGPWFFILPIVNLATGYKVFAETALLFGGIIPIADLAESTAGAVFVMLFWMWYVSQGQVRVDIHLHRIKVRKQKTFSIPMVLIIFGTISLLVAVVFEVMLAILGYSTVTIVFALLFYVPLATVFGTIGSYAGLKWGASKIHE